MDCLAISMITNLASGMQAEITVEEVINCSKNHGPKFSNFVETIIEKMNIDTESNLNLDLKQESHIGHLPLYIPLNTLPSISELFD
jgi:predicted aldo/keto reductase-like oxidoreductase